MEVFGYKAFNDDLTNRYGKKFDVGNVYDVDKKLRSSHINNPKYYGYHMCKNIEDTFRYFDAMDDKIKICFVKGSGEVSEYSDEYYGYYGKFIVSQIELIKLLSRNEIINIGLNLNEFRATRFVSGLRLNSEEIEQFENTYVSSKMVLDAIEYYQKGNKQVYEEGVKKYGQYNNKRR